jgi:3'(2'), 5'-bisphosphate nucleotidase
VTEADEAADALISAGPARGLSRCGADHRGTGCQPRADGETFLIVDPLDGTKEFVQRRGDFTVNIAYVEDGVPLRGVVYAPAKGRLFYTLGRRHARSRKPAPFRQAARPAGAPIQVATARQPCADGGGVEVAPRSGDRRLHRRYAVQAT